MLTLKKDILAKEILLSNSYEEKLYKLNKIMEIEEIQGGYEDIILHNKERGKALLIDSIVLKKKYQNKKSEEIIIKSIKRIQKKYNNMILLASTEFEKDIANKIKLIEFKKLKDNSIIFVKKDK